MKTVAFDQKSYQTTLPVVLEVLTNGGIIVYPTETCYGLGVEATNKQAVQKLLEYKGGRENKAISVAVASRAMAEKYVELNESAENLYETLLPGPVTVISKDRGKVAGALVSDVGTLGIRIPDYPLLLELIEAFGKPITATSANTSGKKPPYSMSEWQTYTSRAKKGMVELWLDAGKLPVRPPSTLVDTTLNEPRVLRQGEVVIPKATYAFGSDSDIETQQIGADIMSANIDYLADKPVIIALQGELGAGKTQLAKGVARALGISDNVKSPTYTIVREYRFTANNFTPEAKAARASGVNGTLFHIDTWRLHEGDELMELGLTDMLKIGNVVVVEWLQKVRPLIQKLSDKAQVVWVDIETTGEKTRMIRWWKKD